MPSTLSTIRNSRASSKLNNIVPAQWIVGDPLDDPSGEDNRKESSGNQS